jgi:hypothetical protein
MATLTVTHSESLVLDGRDRSATSTFSITNIDNIFERTLFVGAAATTIAVFKTTEAITAGAIAVEEAKYIRITNTDTADDLLLTLGIDASEDNSDPSEFISFSIPPGESFILGTPHESAAASSMMSTDTNLHDIGTIIGKNGTDSTNLKVEIYIAGKEA